MDIFVIKGGRIEDVWFKAIRACVEFGHPYEIDKGEFGPYLDENGVWHRGQYRNEFDYVTLNLSDPGRRPLACQSATLTPTTDEEIEKYFHNYLLNPDFTDEEEFKRNAYKYSTWIGPLWQACCDDLLVGMGGCNQACISLGDVFTSELYTRKTLPNGDVRFELTGELKRFSQPPCFRVLDMRVRYGKLHFIIYFRSWDLVAGLPENLGGIQRLKETCLDYINGNLSEEGRPLLEDGNIIASSKGLHIYEYNFPIAKEYVGTAGTALDIPGIYKIDDTNDLDIQRKMFNYILSHYGKFGDPVERPEYTSTEDYIEDIRILSEFRNKCIELIKLSISKS